MPPNLSSPRAVRDLLRRHGVRTLQGLGQHLLLDKNTLEKIVAAGELTPDDTVLEIGPGLGAMTRLIAEQAGHVVGIEVDSGFVRVLKESTGDLPNVVIAHADILKTNLPEFAENHLQPLPAKVVSNIPYNLTSPIVGALLDTYELWKTIVLLVQKEVGERVVAKVGSENYTSFGIHVQFRAEAEIVSLVPRSVFYPPPKVDSAILRLKPRAMPAVQVSDAKVFSRAVRASFSQRRKTLLNSLSAIEEWDRDRVRAALATAGVDPERRGESLSMEEFAALADALSA
jgi:16S rRNA (adenine1518-N6/adenine1519-N6)-dimethyltransferase